jgi:pyridoxine 5-phosphate synthase
MTKLSVNLNKFALLRNARGADFPNVLQKARECIEYGVHGITVHPRPDERHAKYSDVYELSDYLRDKAEIEFNVEGNPVEKFMEIVKETRPDQCTLVPDDPNQVTSDHGWNLKQDADKVQPIIQELKALGIRVSLFIDPDPSQIELAKKIDADRIELYTEEYADTYGTAREQEVLKKYIEAGTVAHELGLGVNAGHDLNLKNLGLLLKNLPIIQEVSIGHAIVVEAFDYSLKSTIEQYIEIIEAVKRG